MSVNWIINSIWILSFLYLFVTAIGTRKSAPASSWMQGRGFRLLSMAIIIALVQLRGFRGFFQRHALPPCGAIGGVIAIALCLLGMALAIWARVHMGRDWGMPMSVKQEGELVTTGPYRLVRHPMYTGFLVAAAGSTLVGGLAGIIWVTVLVYLCVDFAYSARTEERLMAQTFPAAYPEYKKRTKALIPFLI